MDLAKIDACIDELCMQNGLPGDSWQADESDIRTAIGCLVRMMRRRRDVPTRVSVEFEIGPEMHPSDPRRVTVVPLNNSGS